MHAYYTVTECSYFVMYTVINTTYSSVSYLALDDRRHIQMTITTMATTRIRVTTPAATDDPIMILILFDPSSGEGPQSGSVSDDSSVGHEDDTVYWTRLIVMEGASDAHSETAITAEGAPNPFFSRTVILNTTASPLSAPGFLQLNEADTMSEALKLQLHTASTTWATSSFKADILATVLVF